MVNIDELDLKIITLLYRLPNERTITTYTITKKLFHNLNTYELARKTSFIHYRLKKLSLLRLIYIEKNCDKTVYTLILNNCYLTKLKDKKVGLNSNVLMLKLNNKWNAYSL